MKPATDRDRGTVLVLVLVLIVIGSLMVLPLMSYSTSVMRANTVLTDKTKRLEALKGGLRLSLSDPLALYEFCNSENAGPNSPRPLAPVTVNGRTVRSQCYNVWVKSARALDPDEERFGLATTQVGSPIPEELFPAEVPLATPDLPPTRFTHDDPTRYSEWAVLDTPAFVDTDDNGSPDSWLCTGAASVPRTGHSCEKTTTGYVWRPRLPTHALTIRSSAGTKMVDGYLGGAFDGQPDDCTVYFPGTYEDPMHLTGPTFFTSGIYYFKDVVVVHPGADVVVGDGTVTGCTHSQDAVFYAVTAPETHNISGYGATMMFGAHGRLVVSNAQTDGSGQPATGPINFTINQRYVTTEDYGTTPSADVAIISVDGELVDPDGDGPAAVEYRDLDHPFDTDGDPGTIENHDPLFVRRSLVGDDDPATPEVEGGSLAALPNHEPSVFTPKPREPDAPSKPTAVVYREASASSAPRAAVVTWEAPPHDGGRVITEYTVTASGSQQCTTRGTLSCTITGLPTSGSTQFQVIATNVVGPSEASPMSDSVSMSSSPPVLTAPGPPAAPTIEMRLDPRWGTPELNDPYTAGVAHVTFAPPASTGNAPITGYTVEMVKTFDPDGGPDMLPDLPLLLNTHGDQLTGAALSPAVAVGSCDVDMTVQYRLTDGSDWQPDLTCNFEGLDVRAGYSVRVNARTAAHTSTWSTSAVWNRIAVGELRPLALYYTDESPEPNLGVSSADYTAFLDDTSDDASEPRFAFPVHVPAAPPAPAGQQPIPILDFDLAHDAAHEVNVSIPSYVSIAQGRLRVDNPHGHDVKLQGGIVAAQFTVDDGRSLSETVDGDGLEATGPGSVPIGYVGSDVQYTLQLDSWIEGTNERSTSVVQINQNGAYAINSWEVQ